ncbi:MAG: hypothetical protein P4L53_23535 [Candidatus Obscuribacterales bacterium]|nr:hypothetical protein [Candidatus Obscuribacterales bacterium]
MGSFDANGTDVKKPESTGNVTDGANRSGNPTGEASPFADTLRAMSSKPDRHRIAQAADASDSPTEKSEKQFVAQSAHDIRRQLKLDQDANSEDVFKKMGVDSYKYYLAHPKEQEAALKGLGLTKDNISADSITKSIIEQRRAEEHLPPGASLKAVEDGMYKKLYRELKTGTAPIDYD